MTRPVLTTLGMANQFVVLAICTVLGEWPPDACTQKSEKRLLEMDYEFVSGRAAFVAAQISQRGADDA